MQNYCFVLTVLFIETNTVYHICTRSLNYYGGSLVDWAFSNPFFKVLVCLLRDLLMATPIPKFFPKSIFFYYLLCRIYIILRSCLKLYSFFIYYSTFRFLYFFLNRMNRQQLFLVLYDLKNSILCLQRCAELNQFLY